MDKQNSLFSTRLEKRLIISPTLSLNINDYLEGFKREYPKTDNQHRPITQTIYFGINDNLPKEGLIRVRRYIEKPDIELLGITDAEQVFLEIKFINKKYINKYRFTLPYGFIVKNLSNPKDLSSKLSLQSGSKLNENLISFIDKLGNSKLRPILATQVYREHYVPKEQNTNCRITIDKNIRYFAFNTNISNYAIPMGMESVVKFEIKYSKKFKTEIERVVNKLVEKGAFIVKSMQPKVEANSKEFHKIMPENISNWVKSSLASDHKAYSLSDLNLINEFPGIEIEVKMDTQLSNPLTIMNILCDEILKNKSSNFTIVNDRTKVSSIFYYIDYYGSLLKGSYKQIFAIARDPSKKWFVVQAKGSTKTLPLQVGNNSRVVERSEEKFRVYRTYIDEDLDVIKSMYEEKLNLKTEYIGTNNRMKYWIYIKNNLSQRYYNLAVDSNNVRNELMIQIELEYKGIHPKTVRSSSKREILNEMSELINLFINNKSLKASITILSKFDWIKNLNGIK